MLKPADTVMEVSSQELESMVVGPDGLNLNIWHGISTYLRDTSDRSNDMTIEFDLYAPKEDTDGELTGCAIVLNVTFGSGESRTYLFYQSGVVVKELLGREPVS